MLSVSDKSESINEHTPTDQQQNYTLYGCIGSAHELTRQLANVSTCCYTVKLNAINQSNTHLVTCDKDAVTCQVCLQPVITSSAATAAQHTLLTCKLSHHTMPVIIPCTLFITYLALSASALCRTMASRFHQHTGRPLTSTSLQLTPLDCISS